MKIRHRRGRPLTWAAPITVALCGTPAVHAQSAPETPANAQASPAQSVVVTGTRRLGVTIPESLTPIDVINGELLQQQGVSDLNDALRILVPSLNVQRFAAQSYAAAVRPFTLRGLSPDETLVLVNGKRRHRSAAIQLGRPSLASGSQGADLATIPSIAIERIEVLRDGAAAQYGSDAIAGVINFRLKRASEGATLVARYGEYSKGDGADTTLEGNVGFKLLDRGFVNLSVEASRAQHTDRAIQRTDAARLRAAGNTAIADPVQPWGNVQARGARMFVNAELPLAGDTQLYAFGNLAGSRTEAPQFWRDPTPTGSRADIFASVPLTTTAGGRRFSFAQLYPTGLLPVTTYKLSDLSLTGGAKGALSSGLGYDFSASVAQSKLRYGIFDTVNPSLGPTAPLSYDTGSHTQREEQLHADFVQAWQPGFLAKPVNLAFGAELRRETFKVGAGEPDSYRAGPFARVLDPDTNRFIGLAVGSSAFPGFQPSQAGTWSRSNWAAYVDLESEVAEKLTLGLAGRYERFNDFGDTFNWKLSGRYEVAKPFALRASLNTGFRAPTPGQQHVSLLTTNVNQQTGGLLLNATLPPQDAISRYYGARDLKPEESRNYSLGAVLTLAPDLLLTVDYFHIRTTDRIGITSAITISAADRAALEAQGIALNGTQTVAFFANAFSTTTKGVDIVASKRLRYGGLDVDLSAGYNYTKTTPFNIVDTRAVDRERMIELSTFNPRSRGNLTAAFAQGPWNLLARASHYGKWTDAVSVLSATSFDQDHAAKWVFDTEVGFAVTQRLKLALGAQNLFNIYPEREALPANVANGMQYPQHAPFGYNGRFVYARATATF